MSFHEKPFFVVEDDSRETVPLYAGEVKDMPPNAYGRLFDEASGYIPRVPVFCGPLFTANETEIAEVLACVRAPEKNVTHPDVVSAPTIRTETDRFVRIERASKKLGMTAVQHLFHIDGDAWQINHSEGEVPDIQAIIDRLLTVKFGISEATFSYQYVLHSLTLADSRIGVTDDWKDIIEKIAMLNALVCIAKEDMHKIPPQSEHYSDIRWVSWKIYKKMQDNKNLLDVYDDKAAQYCLHGVCNTTSRTALDDINNLIRAGLLQI